MKVFVVRKTSFGLVTRCLPDEYVGMQNGRLWIRGGSCGGDIWAAVLRKSHDGTGSDHSVRRTCHRSCLQPRWNIVKAWETRQTSASRYSH